ncbi:hypothetical protein B0T25DRAFT_177124 [Lasiosphaeria hispida]|uniref:Uncharacterized protein n=1 Tax=Lasiosphaeria hispida TaxID=260671 RepID=A0AAJ0HNH3_9PEZI|nr:hypothetical protein B0T25DRAFT_177124 [Lasiosphaeria hispida]
MSQSRGDSLRAQLGSPNSTPRPLLTSLNGDNSWLMSFPRPAAERARSSGKAYFHIVSDPWLTGSANAGADWIVSIRTPAPAAIPSGAAVEAVIGEIEDAAASAGLISAPPTTTGPSAIDAIFLNFHYSDHLDEATLRTFHPEVPVFATADSAAIIRRWGYFSHVAETRDLEPGTKWSSLHPGAALPEWLTVFRLRGHHELNFATAIIYSSVPSEGGEEKHEALLYSPHGIRTDQAPLKALLVEFAGGNGVSVLAILHALKDSFAMGRATTLGVAGGLALQRVARPKYWVKSHDAPLLYGGVAAWLLWINDVTRTLKSGLDEEERVKGSEHGERKEPYLVEVENGGCFVLE